MKNIYIIAFGIIFSAWANAQNVGINTDKPQKTLHIRGNVQFTKDLRVGGTANTVGDPGEVGQVLVSQGKNKAPKWVTPKTLQTLPYIISIARKTGDTTEYPSGSTQIPKFDANNVIIKDSEYLSYNSSTGEFTILIAGVYRIYIEVTYDTSSNPSGQTAGHARTTFYKNGIQSFARSTYHGERTPHAYHTFSGIEKFETGDKFKVETFREQKHKISKINVTTTFNGSFQ